MNYEKELRNIAEIFNTHGSHIREFDLAMHPIVEHFFGLSEAKMKNVETKAGEGRHTPQFLKEQAAKETVVEVPPPAASQGSVVFEPSDDDAI